MNTIREIKNLNKRELENVVPPEASWHTDYRNTAYVHLSGLPFALTEGDVLTIFSQFGEPTFLHLARDKETGKSRGYGWLKYEDQRSTDLAVDNLGGADVLGRQLKVDHAWYKRRDDETEEEAQQRELKLEASPSPMHEREAEDKEARRPMLQEELELQKLVEQHDEEDPMKDYLVQQKRNEVQQALAASKSKHHHKRHRHDREKRRDRGRSKRHDLSQDRGNDRHEPSTNEGKSRRKRSRDREHDRDARSDIEHRSRPRRHRSPNP